MSARPASRCPISAWTPARSAGCRRPTATASRRLALATVEAVFETAIDFMDTSNEYGKGESERRIGSVISAMGGLPDGFVMATKADSEGRDFSAERVRRSFEESRERLGLERFDIFHLHDPERFSFEEITAPGGALEDMQQLKAEGLVTAIGVAGGDLEAMDRYVDLGVFDVLLNHNRFTLLDQSASPLMTKAVEMGMTYLNAAPYASGLLAKPLEARAAIPVPRARPRGDRAHRAPSGAVRFPRRRAGRRRAAVLDPGPAGHVHDRGGVASGSGARAGGQPRGRHPRPAVGRPRRAD